MHVIHEPVGRRGQAIEVGPEVSGRRPGFRVCDLGSVHESHPLSHSAVRVGGIGVGDRQVDEGLDRRLSARLNPRVGRVEHHDVDDRSVVALGLQRRPIDFDRIHDRLERLQLGRERRRIDLANDVRLAADEANLVQR